MEFEPGVILAILWVVVSLIGGISKGGKERQRRAQQRARQRAEERAEVTTGRPGQPTTFEELLAEMRGQLEQAQRQEQRPTPGDEWERAIAEAEEVEETTSLEEEPVVVSLDVAPEREERPTLVQDETAEALVRARIAAAERRNREWRLEDHRRFDAQIRATPAPVVAPARTIPLRQAILWREILSPPVSLRPDGDAR